MNAVLHLQRKIGCLLLAKRFQLLHNKANHHHKKAVC
jgi:hypothetical protein